MSLEAVSLSSSLGLMLSLVLYGSGVIGLAVACIRIFLLTSGSFVLTKNSY